MCQLKRGDVDIRYPFGIGPGCFRPGFEIVCDNKGSGGEVKPRLPTTRDQSPFPVLSVSVTPRLEATVKLAAGDLAVLQLHWRRQWIFIWRLGQLQPAGRRRVPHLQHPQRALRPRLQHLSLHQKREGPRQPLRFRLLRRERDVHQSLEQRPGWRLRQHRLLPR
jgi:hypothetical protein